MVRSIMEQLVRLEFASAVCIEFIVKEDSGIYIRTSTVL